MLYQLQHYMFDFAVYSSYLLLILAHFGLFNGATNYVVTINNYLKLYVCLFLMWRFHPFRRTQLTELDRKIAFRAGVFVMTTTIINEYIVRIIAWITHVV